ncbi:MAG: hypothetical protein WB615_16740, partial [Candidatus Tumulicola sp.]
MTVRGIPGALALGLLASLLAHAALYGGHHAMGGAYHDALSELAGAGGAGFAVLLAALAWTGSRVAADGSILAARLGSRLPAIGPVAAAAGLWFALAERIEPRHGDAGLLL